jgi:hypothetical protein
MVYLKLIQDTVVILAATLFRGLTRVGIGGDTAAVVTALAASKPVIKVCAALMAERAVLPDTRVTVLTPLGLANRLCNLLLANDLPITSLLLNRRKDRQSLTNREIITPQHPLGNINSK